MRKRLQRWTAAVAVLAAGATVIVSTASSTPAAASGTPSATAAASGGLGAGAVTNYLKYVEAKKGGAANKSLSPVQIGFVNQQGGPVVIGANATNGTELAIAYANAQLGGIDGHPIKLDTCFIASAEAEGTTCGEKFLSIKGLSVIDEGAVATGIQSLYRTLGGTRPVIAGVAITPVDAVQKKDVILFGDGLHVLPPYATYAKNVLHAKTVADIYENEPGIVPSAQAQIAALKADGISVTSAAYPPTEADVITPLTTAKAASADMVIVNTDANGCVNMANALTQVGVTDAKKIVANPLCLNAQVISALGDFPKWTYGIASSLDGDTSDAGVAPYVAVAKKYGDGANAPDPWNIVNFGVTMSTIRFLNQVANANGVSGISPARVLAAAKAFKGPQALGAPSLACGKFSSAPAVCNDRAQFFSYSGKGVFTKSAGWLEGPPGT
ncbi:MAG TPA: ABC transporter substrate-binding protein [Solirubrobacteraceae bacterium]|nr:ABC transporter substrate-binding protein [Solirubrobacteraceae bacterium]